MEETQHSSHDDVAVADEAAVANDVAAGVVVVAAGVAVGGDGWPPDTSDEAHVGDADESATFENEAIHILLTVKSKSRLSPAYYTF